ncbi:sarcosine oxidase subunit alpha family protein [Anianabacter salinae]|uniref:sarcosine oxidase subunit alpha family protein n=1 Tax=Anianabacter salinae TaxID=2851023 RepID=UPI00225E1097|nr:sarcosine oxidase subunit alpha family protein [Anianabacter salinae]MBV0912810.1 sarcosine oxidase subunit alpha family protein [Anianabacter salinae]
MRVEGYGLVDRARPVRFSFDGQGHEGFAGDTLASALLAGGMRLMGRSFKYHRPRGVFTCGSEEPSALMTVGDTPNVRATVQEVFAGLEARSQNAWPSLKWDALEVNDLLSPFLGAGFYYKTFMGPHRLWERLFEPVIRRAAGLGALSGARDAARYEKAFAHCDLLVIGAGPAGLMAALVAARSGAEVILADEGARMGGRMLLEDEEVGGLPGTLWADEVLAELAALPNVRLMPRTTVTGAYDHGTYGALERVALHLPDGDAPRECFWRIVARRAVLAAGAIERPIAHPGNDRPGVMLAGAVRGYLHRYGVAAGKRVVVFANNDDAHRTVQDLHAAGVRVAAVVDSRPEVPRDAPWPVHAGAVVAATRGRLGLEAVQVRGAGREIWIEADCLAVSGGWNPALHLTSHMGARPVWNEAIAAFVPLPGAVPGLEAAGAAAGVMDTAGCLADGLRAGKAALKALGRRTKAVSLPEAVAEVGGIDAFWQVQAKGRAWLDLQNDVTTKDVALAAQENFRSVEHMKRYTTQGMATDQGKTSNVTALAVLADATGRSIPATGTTTFRPPYTPVSIAAMGAGALGDGFAPQRFTTSDSAARQRGAPMIEAGLWYRPSYFPAPGEATWREASDREVGMVRQAVGVTDVSTLGKIDVQGRDAGRFLDFVYTGRMSTLKPGRVRYGLMLREDGHVMDDGTAARLNDGHYLITTTTAAAGQVMQHLDFVAQVLRPDLDVSLMSVTEQWAQFAVAGPRALELVNAVTDAEITDAEWPFMSCGAVPVAGVAGRLFRISFSGERGYEIAVPARYGESLWRLLVAQAEMLGGGPYGMEALNVLRIEKGFLTHAELHGRTTAFDLGMQGMLKSEGDFIGKAGAARPGLLADDREQLVGLRPVGAVKQLLAGAHLFEAGAEAVRENSQGYVTSAGYSPTLQSYLGLAFLKGGRARLGETVRMVDHLRSVQTLCEVVAPQVFDAGGGRMRG